MRKLSFIVFILSLPLISNAQKHKKTPVKNKKTCATYVYNLTTDKMTIRDICVYVELTDHIDMNDYRVGQRWDKQYDNWKFSIDVFDNDKLKKDNTKASFIVYEDNTVYSTIVL